MLELKNLYKTFNAGTVNEKRAIDGLDLTLEDGDFVTIIGGNGAGKSTTLNLIAGVFPADQGNIILDGVDITGEELAKIETLEGKQIRRLAFTLLCVAKYWDAASDRNNGWVNTSDKEIMQMANINTSIKRQSLMFAELRDAGFIRFSKKIDNLNVQVQFIQAGETAIHIQDFRNLGYQYLKYYGGAYFECENCGLTVKAQSPAKGRPQKYCPSCAVEVKTRQTVNAVMRCRNALKS